jgi:flagellar assembly protein FliH
LSSKIIPKGAVPDVRRLELGDLASGTKPGARMSTAARPAAIETAQSARAREQAYREGLEAGRREGHAAVEAQRAELKALIAGVNELMQDFEQTLANDVLSMSLELAKQIVRQSLRVKPELVLAVVREAISSLPGLSEQSVLLLNPADAPLVRNVIESDPSLAALPWKIVEDGQVERGGCRLETPTTEVDAGLETRWRRVVASLGRDDSWIDITT